MTAAGAFAGGSGHDLFILKESAVLVNGDSFNFRQDRRQRGRDTAVHHQRSEPRCRECSDCRISKSRVGFQCGPHDHHAGSFQVDGLKATGIIGLELQIDSVSTIGSAPRPIAPALEKQIREALATPGRPGVRKIAARFGVNPGTVQRISRPFVVRSVVAVVP
jgi:hypothetical protein